MTRLIIFVVLMTYACQNKTSNISSREIEIVDKSLEEALSLYLRDNIKAKMIYVELIDIFPEPLFLVQAIDHPSTLDDGLDYFYSRVDGISVVFKPPLKDWLHMDSADSSVIENELMKFFGDGLIIPRTGSDSDIWISKLSKQKIINYNLTDSIELHGQEKPRMKIIFEEIYGSTVDDTQFE